MVATPLNVHWFVYSLSATHPPNQELQSFPDPSKAVVFYSAHGVPKSYVEEAGDPYKEEMEQCVGLVQAELGRRGVGNRHVLAYQSRVGPVEWLQPYTDDSIRYV